MKEFDEQYYQALDRKVNPVEGSYTSYLYDKGIEKILKKVGEEATEVVIAAMKDNKEELVGEISDLLYHIVVMMVEKGVTLENVADEFNRRSQKTGNLKPERKPIEKI